MLVSHSVAWLALLLFLLAPTSWQLFNCLRRMEMPLRGGGRISRRENPLSFWSAVALQCGLICVFVALMIWHPKM